MTPSNQNPIRKALGLVACALALGLNLQPINASAADVPGVKLLATDPNALSGASSGAFTLIRIGDSNLTLSATVDISGTASNGVDYAALNNVWTLAPGVLAMDVLVQPVVNPANRGNKTVVLTLETNAAFRVYGNPTATVKITDDLYDVPPPSVTMTSPADGSVFTAPATITLSAAVSDPDLPIQSVSFYDNDHFLGSVSNAPYTLVWTNPHTGRYSLFSRAVDQFGKSGVATPVDIIVSATPVVTVSTTDGASAYDLGQKVPLQAQIGDPNEPIQSVSFYVNNKLVGTATQAPFVLSWSPQFTGIYTVNAVAIDQNTGKKGVSAKFQIFVTTNAGS